MPEGPPPPEYPPPFPCGGVGQPACPPQPAIEKDAKAYSYNDMLAHGQACYEKGKKDAKE